MTLDMRVGIEIIRKRLDAYDAASNEGQLPLDYRMTAVEMLAAHGRALKLLDDIHRNAVDDERFLLQQIDRLTDHDCHDWNSGGVCAVCRRSIPVAVQQRGETTSSDGL